MKGEFEIIERIRQIMEEVAVPEKGSMGIGDDCAVIEAGGQIIVSTDMLVEGSHFLFSDIDPYDLGWKSAAVNISDIAAMGGAPVGTFLSLGLPKGLSDEWIDAFSRGYRDLSLRYGAKLLGGDTTSSPLGVVINVTVTGRIPEGSRLLKRSAAKPGDLIAVGGNLGDSGGGLKLILGSAERGEDEQILIKRHYRPIPQISLGQQLAANGKTHAAMDISDGLAGDLMHILKASGVDARVHLDKLPISDELRRCSLRYGWDSALLAATAGEDYVLLFTAAPDAELPEGCTVVGSILERQTEQANIQWMRNGNPLRESLSGFTHF